MLPLSSLDDIVAEDGRRIVPRFWPADGDTRAVIQILHGLAEHAGRYARFAEACNRRGVTVVAHDHRGHGNEFAPSDLGHFADADGWSNVLGDVAVVLGACRQRFAGVPLVLFGHSMGSYIAQNFVMRNPKTVDALVLSGSTWPRRMDLYVGRVLARIALMLRGPRAGGGLFDRMSFGQFNKRFAPNRTEFDWLSRDEQEVDEYVADPLCGAPSGSRLWYDLFGGLLEISRESALRKVPTVLPILITGGELDPVGGAKALTRLAAEYEATGHENVTLKLYPGGRHEMVNETNRDEVTADILAWIDTVV